MLAALRLRRIGRRGEMSDDEFTDFLTKVMTRTDRALAHGGQAYVCMGWQGAHNVTDGGEARRPCADQPLRLGQDDRRHGQPLPFAA